MVGKHVVGTGANTLAQMKLDLRIEEIAERAADAAFDRHHDHLSHGERVRWNTRYDAAKCAARLAFARETTPPVPNVADDCCPGDSKPCFVGGGTDDAHYRCGTSACPNQAILRKARSTAPVDDISYAGAEMEDGPATPPVDAGQVEAVALALCNEDRRFMGFSPYDAAAFAALEDHRRRDWLRYAGVIVALSTPTASEETVRLRGADNASL